MFLATTALTEFWDTSGPILVLGEWCRPLSKKREWGSLDIESAPYPFRDQERIAEAAAYCHDVTSRLLDALVPVLNEAHDERFDRRAWDLVLNPWLQWFVGHVYHHYVCLLEAADRYPDLTSIGLEGGPFQPVSGTRDFVDLQNTDLFNLRLFTEIMPFTGIRIERRGMPAGFVDPSAREEKEARVGKLAWARRSAARFIIRRMLRPAKCLAFSLPLDWHETLRLILFTRFTVLPYLPYPLASSTALPPSPPDWELRKEIAERQWSFTPVGKFEELLRAILLNHVPTSFLEDFQTLSAAVSRHFPKFPRMIASTHGWYRRDAFKLWSARAVMHGTRLAGFQHGGASGMRAVSGEPAFEHHRLERSFSWGWRSDRSPNVVPLVGRYRKVSRHKSRVAASQCQRALYVATQEPRYIHEFVSKPFGPLFLDYLAWQERFFRSVSSDIRAATLVRLHRTSEGVDDAPRLEEFPELTLDPLDRPFLEQVAESELIVIDNLNTTWFECLAADVPTVLFWDPDLWRVTDEAKPIFSMLEDSGIYHRLPEDAAQLVSDVWHDPEAWWRSERVQEGRIAALSSWFGFSDRKQWLRVWANALRVNANGQVSGTAEHK